ncbi:hypothetical protein CICLE_v10002879mg [Citrus x clementina]|uniref:Uncharacterized protein n=2 Tax=Citrus TaxID=2706 RepID=A0A067DXA0_CITSI|nr:hypothetical protein CICLE_v10002879mg [Citrus x clementina]KDO46180.1 hypothetical protein CISIN_1g038874mg [Citrus sinensis]
MFLKLGDFDGNRWRPKQLWEQALNRWRSACAAVKNRRGRFRVVVQTNKLLFFVLLFNLSASAYDIPFLYVFLAASFSSWLLDFKASLKFYLVWSFFFLLVLLLFFNSFAALAFSN